MSHPDTNPPEPSPFAHVPPFADRERLARVAKAIVATQDALDALVRDLVAAAGLSLDDPRTRERLAEAVHAEHVRREVDALARREAA